MTIITSEALDVWFKFENAEDEEPSHEANTYETEDGFVIEHYHTGVGQVTQVEFDTLEAAHAWYEKEGFEDFSS